MTEDEAAQETVKPYREQVSKTPALLSVLYDVDLLPEQITKFVNARRMVLVCECFKRMTPEQALSLFDKSE